MSRRYAAQLFWRYSGIVPSLPFWRGARRGRAARAPASRIFQTARASSRGVNAERSEDRHLFHPVNEMPGARMVSSCIVGAKFDQQEAASLGKQFQVRRVFSS